MVLYVIIWIGGSDDASHALYAHPESNNLGCGRVNRHVAMIARYRPQVYIHIHPERCALVMIKHEQQAGILVICNL